MTVMISYMGTKRELAGTVAGLIKSLPRGPVLDAFSGMCAVGEAIAKSRVVWTNDSQPMAALVGKALFRSRSAPRPSKHVFNLLEKSFNRNRRALETRFARALELEQGFLLSEKLGDLRKASRALEHLGNTPRLERERQRLARKPHTFPYRLASITYPGTFFGLAQCIEIDSARYAIDDAYQRHQLSSDDRRWLLIAVCSVASRINNSTGQFAQYIRPQASNLPRVVPKRRRSLWEELPETLDSLRPAGTASNRRRSRCFNSDSLRLLGRLRTDPKLPSVVYADPPYSRAQYSRYYHVLDVLIRYDYPKVSGTGRYPTDRFQTQFGHARKVGWAMDRLVHQCARLGTTLVLSYPSNGLFEEAGGNMLELLGRHYRHARVAHSQSKSHSTFGGSRATATVQAQENIYLAHSPIDKARARS